MTCGRDIAPGVGKMNISIRQKTTGALTAGAIGFGVLVGCASQSSDNGNNRRVQTSVESRGDGGAGDEQCMVLSRSPTPVFAAIYEGGEDGSLEFGNGQSLTISNSDGVTFDWTSTRRFVSAITRKISRTAAPRMPAPIPAADHRRTPERPRPAMAAAKPGDQPPP